MPVSKEEIEEMRKPYGKKKLRQTAKDRVVMYLKETYPLYVSTREIMEKCNIPGVQQANAVLRNLKYDGLVERELVGVVGYHRLTEKGLEQTRELKENEETEVGI